MTFRGVIDKHPIVGKLFPNRATCIDDVTSSLERSAFVAVDTEYIEDLHDTLHQVGVAYIPDLTPPARTPDDRLVLKDFVQYGQISGKSLNIVLSADEEEELLQSARRKTMPTSWPSRMLADENCSLATLEHRLDALVQQYKEDATRRGKEQLVLVVFENAADWKYMTLYFGRVARHFARWLDVRDLGREAASRNQPLPALKSTLRVFGYRWPPISDPAAEADAMCDPLRSAKTHNAGDDAVMTLAALEGFLSPALRASMASYQGLRSIMSWASLPPLRAEFAATIEPVSQSRLPHCMGVVTRAARYFWPQAPTLLHISCQPQENWQRGWQKVGVKGWIAFETEARLERFIEAYHQATVDGVTLQVRRVQREKAELRRRGYRTSEQSGQLRTERKSMRDDYQALRESGFEITGWFTA